MLKTLTFIAKHPLTRDQPLAGFARFAKWQIQSRLTRNVEVQWVGGAKLVVSNGMTGATGNIYCGLHEFADMGFMLHLLRPDDLFVDVGANIGSYTILASAVVGAQTIAAEPDPHTMQSLKRNIEVNNIGGRVCTVPAAIGREPGTMHFTIGLDTTNRMATANDADTRKVRVETLDNLLRGKHPLLIKLDVEGFEAEVLAGGRETLRKGSLLAVETECIEAAVLGPLIAAGFEQSFYDPFSRRLFDKPIHIHSNALFIRNRKLIEDRLQRAPKLSIFGKSV